MDGIFVVALATFLAMMLLWLVLPASAPTEAATDDAARSLTQAHSTSA